MPTILTRSAGSARGYGLTGNPTIHRVQQTLQSTTWTAPAGVTNLLTVTGKGQDGVAAFWTPLYGSFISQSFGSTLAYISSNAAVVYTSSEVEGFAQSQWDLFPNGPGDGVVNVTWTQRGYTVPSGPPLETQYSATIRAVGTKGKGGVTNGWGKTWPPFDFGWYDYDVTNMEYYTPQFDGANTTGFGYTFAGGVGAAATPTTYNNVAVTPGTTYTINSTGDGYIIIVYYLQV